MGCGPIRSLALELGEKLRRGQTLVVICGTNKKLMRQLSEENTKDNVKIIGFTQKMPLYMAAADLAPVSYTHLDVYKRQIQLFPA